MFPTSAYKYFTSLLSPIISGTHLPIRLLCVHEAHGIHPRSTVLLSPLFLHTRPLHIHMLHQPSVIRHHHPHVRQWGSTNPGGVFRLLPLCRGSAGARCSQTKIVDVVVVMQRCYDAPRGAQLVVVLVHPQLVHVHELRTDRCEPANH